MSLVDDTEAAGPDSADLLVREGDDDPAVTGGVPGSPRPADMGEPFDADAFDADAFDADAFDPDAFATELDAIRDEVLATRGAQDAEYLRRLIRLQRRCEVAGRIALMAGVFPPAWLVGVGLLSTSKILENMEIGHNVMHGQWDWMRDPDINSATWEWDNVCPSEQWRHTHNHMHHQWTNVRGYDADIGYGLFRVDQRQRWNPEHRFQPLAFVGLALAFEFGVGFHDAMSHQARLNQAAKDRSNGGSGELPPGCEGGPSVPERVSQTLDKVRSQAFKDYLAWPALSVPFGVGSVLSSLSGALAANVVRNVWSFAVIFCGHFPDGAEFFDPEEVEGESRGEWYRRQVTGSVNFTGGRLMDLLSGNLDHQIEHHLFPDMPSNRYAEVAPKVREVCQRHGVKYNTASFAHQLGTVVRKIWRLARP